jgi:hypothetical protein
MISKRPSINILRIGTILSIVLYLGSLVEPAIIYKNEPDLQALIGTQLARVDYGFQVLVWGWAGVLFGENFAWLANLFGSAACITILFARRPAEFGFAFALAALAFLISLNSFSLTRVPLDEAGVNWAYFDHFATGFYLWELSFVVLSITLCVRFIRESGRAAVPAN